MGLFRNKKVAEENEFEGATEWFKAQAKTAETFNNEDKDMEGQDTPKQARIFIAIEHNEKEGMVAASARQTARRFSSTHCSSSHSTRIHSRSSSLQQQPS